MNIPSVITICSLWLITTVITISAPLKFSNGKTRDLDVQLYDNGWILYADAASNLHSLQDKGLSQSSLTELNSKIRQKEIEAEWFGKVVEMPSEFPPVPPRGWQLVGWEKSNRDHIQNFNQSDYGKKWTDCVPNSMVNSFKWWHNRDLFQLPKKLDYEKQVHWLHVELAKLSSTGMNSGTSLKALAKAMAKFSQKHLAAKFLFPLFEVPEIDPKKLTFYTTNNAAAILTLSVFYGSDYISGHAVTLTSAKPDGSIKFTTWGHKFSGKLIPQQGNPGSYDIELYNQNELPNSFIKYEINFKHLAKERDSFYICLPYEKMQAGQQLQPHPELAEFNPEDFIVEKKEHKVIVEWNTCGDDKFTRKKPFTSTWRSKEGKSLQATLIDHSDEKFHFSKDRRKFTLSHHELSFESQLKAQAWSSNLGTSYPLPACILHYELKPEAHGKNGTIITIEYNGDEIAEANLPHMRRKFRYNHTTKTLSTHHYSGDGSYFETTVGETSNPFHKYPMDEVSLCNCDHAKNAILPSRSVKIGKLKKNQLSHANFSAPAITRLLLLINGSPVHTNSETTKFIYTFGNGKPCKDNSLVLPLDIAHQWDILPTKYEWNTQNNKYGSLKLIKITEPELRF